MGGGGKGYVGPPLKLFGGGGLPPGPLTPPLPAPMISSHSFISILYPFTVLSGNTVHLRYLINEIV